MQKAREGPGSPEPSFLPYLRLRTLVFRTGAIAVLPDLHTASVLTILFMIYEIAATVPRPTGLDVGTNRVLEQLRSA